jgi:hypothetical protein
MTKRMAGAGRGPRTVVGGTDTGVVAQSNGSKVPPVGAAVERAAQKFRAGFKSMADGFASVMKQRRDLLPQFRNLWELWQADRKAAGVAASAVAFAAYIDPTVDPKNREAYRQHPTVQALDYMRRLYREQVAADGGAAPVASNRPKSFNTTQQLARTLATVLQMVPKDTQGAFWSAFRDSMGLTQGALGKLITLTGKAKPFVVVPDKLIAAIRKIEPIQQEIGELNGTAAAPATVEGGEEIEAAVEGRGKRRATA